MSSGYLWVCNLTSGQEWQSSQLVQSFDPSKPLRISDGTMIEIKYVRDAYWFLVGVRDELHKKISDAHSIWALKHFIIDCDSRDAREDALDFIEDNPPVIQWYVFMGYKYIAYIDGNLKLIRGDDAEIASLPWVESSNMYIYSIDDPLAVVPDVTLDCRVYGELIRIEGVRCDDFYIDQSPKKLCEIVKRLANPVSQHRDEFRARQKTMIRITWDGYLRLWAC